MIFEKFKIKKSNKRDQKLKKIEQVNSEKAVKDIAVIGMSGRFPEATNYNEFWENIKCGKNLIREIPKERWDWKKYYRIHGKIKDRFVSHWGGFMREIEQFDLRFFQLSQREADAMDPQQRILLEEAWSCLEDAGICPSKMAGSNTGVYIAGCQFDYRDLLERNQETIVPHSTLGIASSLLANRISYFFDFKGPSITLDTACAGALTAIHYGVEALRSNECETALVGGINVILSPNNYIRLSKMQVLSQTGSLKALDEAADGFIRGEGVGLLLLKPLDKALEDGDMIYGCIKGTAVNHSGRTKSISYPSADAQANVIIEAIEKSNIPAETISYIELHGTGTPKGDPIEVEGLKKAFDKLMSQVENTSLRTQFCGIGSVKTNIGHLEGAAGMPSIFKVLLAMKHRQLPPTINFNHINPKIEIENSPFYVVDNLTEWATIKNEFGEIPLRAGISSFGLGGTNAHIIVEEFKEKHSDRKNSGQYVLICLSSKTDQGLLRNADALAQFLCNRADDINLQDIGYTLACCRDHFEKRITLIADSVYDLIRKCSQIANGNKDIRNESPINLDKLDEMAVKIKSHTIDFHSQEYKEFLETLAQIYMSGNDVDWNQLYETSAYKVHLPTYSFEPTKCWIPDANKLVDDVLPMESNEECKKPDNINIYTEKWVELAAGSSLHKEQGTLCLLIPQNYELRNGFKSLDKILNTNCIYCKEGIGYRKISENQYEIGTNLKEDYQKLFYEIKNKIQGKLTIINLLPIGDSLHRKKYEEMLYLLQSISETKFRKVDLFIIGCYENMLERCYLESCIGYERTAKIAFHQINIKLFIMNKKDYDNDSLEKLVVQELKNGFPNSVLYENKKRKVLQLEKLQLENNKTIFKNNGSYIITGGAGGLGILLAKYLLMQYNAHIYLIGRSSAIEKQLVLYDLQNMGGSVTYLQADVSDLEQMNYVVKNVTDKEGRINGVIHAAGIYQGHTFIEKDKDEFYSTLKPKIEGTIAIEAAMKEQNYDFICYFSSISAIVGDMGDCDYSIGNRFMKAYANWKNKETGKKHIVINWPIWEHGGMELGTQETAQMYLKSSGQKLLTDTLGMNILELCLVQKDSDVTVVNGTGDIVKQYILPKNKIIENPRIVAVEKEEDGGKFEIIDELKNAVIEDLRELSSSILDFEKKDISIEANFSDLGYDSVNLMDLAEALSQRINKNIQPDIFFRYPNIRQLTSYLIEAYQNQLKNIYQSDKEVNRIEIKEKSDFREADEPVAIIGMSGLFPGADSVENLWNILIEGREVIQEIPKRRIEFPNDEDRSTKGVPWQMGMLSDPSQFDPLFFEISPGEAEEMDPRQRMLLEETWKALEDAQLGELDLNNANVGTFVGVEDGDYRLNTGENVRITSNHTGILASRLAYYLNFKGASIAINTACSSSLTALHQACLSLKNDDCDIAVVAGASLISRPETYLGMVHSGMIASDGKCYAFDQRANGLIPGEAVAVIILRKFSIAEKENNRIYAKILGTGINYDGKTNGITAPNGKAQAELYRKLYRKIGICTKEIEYIISHGTGTKLGDPIEMNALDEVFREDDCPPGNCAVTSVKPNIGHTLAASGIVNVISLVMAMRHKLIPGSLHCEQPSEFINWNNSPLYINTEKKVWNERGTRGRIGAVSSFGVSGTNVHVVLESYEEKAIKTQRKKNLYYIILLSAKTQTSLEKKLYDMKDIFEQHEDSNLPEISYALMDARYHFNYRCAILIKNVDEAIQCIKNAIEGKLSETVLLGKVDVDFCENSRVLKLISKNLQILHEQAANESTREVYLELMKYYCQGYRISGRELFGEKIICRINLPHYPFENKQYWVKNNTNIPIEPRESKQATEEVNVEEVEDELLEVSWEQVTNSIMSVDDNLPTLLLYHDDNWIEEFKSYNSNIQFCKQPINSSIEQLTHQIKEYKNIKHFVWVSQHSTEQDDTILSFFRLIKAFTQLGFDQEDIHISVITVCGQNIGCEKMISPNNASVDGLACVLAKEMPNWNVRIYDIEDMYRIPIEEILCRTAETGGKINVYRNSAWYSQKLVEHKAKKADFTKYRKSGVYVVIGGAGGIGGIWSQYMISNYNAQIIWVGRSELNSLIREKIKQISVNGNAPEYLKGDVTNLASLTQVYSKIKSMYGRINGLVHSAVGEFDKGIVNMTYEEYCKVLSVKRKGVLYMNEVFGQEPLDFVLYFSSLSSFERPQGQGGYVSGCCFVDAFAKQLQQKVPYAVRTINWGFWGNIGAAKSMAKSMQFNIERTGSRPLDPKNAMEIIEKILCDDTVQLAYTRRVKSRSKKNASDELNIFRESQQMKQKCQNEVTRLLSAVLKIPMEEFDPMEGLDKYGLDSITILQLIREFRKVFNNLDSTIFYECFTINEITEFIIKKYKNVLDKMLKNQKMQELGTMKTNDGNKETGLKKSTLINQYMENHIVDQEKPIAIIGMSGKFPKAENLDDFWENIKNGIDCVSEIPNERWRLNDFYEPDMELAIKQQLSYCKVGGFIDGYANFDSQFFKISPAEALVMDPQERQILEQCWKVFENAGYTKKRIQEEFHGNIGVFVGVTRTGYDLYGPKLWENGKQILLGTSFSSMSNRISYFFDLKGPCMSIDTMCSSSLTALHEACEHIRRGECEMSLLASANIYTHSATYKQFCQKRMLSLKGRCYAFSADADGFVPGEGVGAILLKPLSKAIKDHDQIHGIIRSTVVNHCGKTSGFTVPSPDAQKDMIINALRKANINPEEITYVEAHGTGTKLGDPIEIAGLTKAYRKYTNRKQFCAIGSVKTNIGHCEATSGLAGVLKVILQMKHGMLAPSLFSECLNPLIDFQNSPFYVQRELSEWERPISCKDGISVPGKRLAGVSSFGAGGSNAHVILEEYVE